MGWADRVTREEVNGIRAFAAYAAQESGTPYPSKQHLFAAENTVKQLFEMYPELSWQSMCRLVDWAKDNKRRFPHIEALIASYRYAYADGYLTVLNTDTTENLEAKIARAIEEETDPEWLRRLRNSKGPGRKVVYAAWLKKVEL